jgi:hypothetical protein
VYNRSKGFNLQARFASHIVVATALFIASAEARAFAQQVYTPISPLDIPGNTIVQQLGPNAAKAKQVFRDLTRQAQAEQAAPPVPRGTVNTYTLATNFRIPLPPPAGHQNDIVDVPGTYPPKKVDLKNLFFFINRIQKVLVAHHQSLVGAQALKVVDLNRYPELRMKPNAVILKPPPSPAPAPTQGNPATPRVSAESLRLGSTNCPSPEPTTINEQVLQTAWSQIARMQDNDTTLSRCDLVFRDELDTAEAAAPLATIPPTIPIYVPAYNNGGSNHWAQIYLDNGLGYTTAVDSTGLAYSTKVRGQFFDKAWDLAAICAMVSSKKGSDPSATLNISVGNRTVFATHGSWRDYSLSWPKVQDYPLIAPIDENFTPFNINMHAQLRVTGSYGLTATVHTRGTAAYLMVDPTVKADATGSYEVSYIIISSGISGNLNLIDGNGSFGGIVAVVPDITDPNSGATTRKMILLVGSVDEYNATAFAHSVTLYAKLFGTVTLVNQPIQIFPQGQVSLVNHPSDGKWHAYYLVSNARATPAATMPTCSGA